MKGKEGKGDRSSIQTSGRSGGGGGSVTETGALFPRLNVKETKRVGPRAPPRNKMALYEQFTFPSHRYVPPSLPLPASKPPTTYTPQRLPYEGSMFYGPVPAFGGMPGMPWMPYSEMYTGSYFGGQLSVNGSSSSTVVDCEGDLRQGSGAPASDPSRPSSNSEGRWSPWVSSHSNVESISSKKARNGSDQARNSTDRVVPTYNPPAANSNGPPSPKAGSDQNNPRARHHQHGVESASARQQGSVSSHRHVESSRTHGEPRISRGGANGGGKKADKSCKAGNKGHGEDLSDVQESTIAEKEKDLVVSRKSLKERSDSHHNNKAQDWNFQYQQQKASEEDVSSDVEYVPSRANSSGECLTGMEESRGQPSKVIHKAGSSFKSSQARDSAHTNPTARDIARNEKAGSTHKHAQTMDSALTNATARDTPQKEKRRGFDSGEQQMLNKETPDCKSASSAASGDDLEITSAAATSDVSQPDEVQSDRAESDAFESEAETEFGRILSKVAPRDIVNIIGEQEFWRARKLILRQQKIFSAQLFELHRIIKVQQLLAASPLTNEEAITNKRDAEMGMSEPDQAEQLAYDVEKVPQNVEALPAAARRKAAEDPKGNKQPDSSGQSSTSDRQCDVPSHPVVNSQSGQQSEAGQVPSNGAQGADSSASWGGQPYPKAGANNNWFGAVPAPNAAYMYQPYPGSFPSPQVHQNMGAYNGAYPSVMCAPPGAMDVPSMTPYGVPRYEQQPNLMPDMYRYNSYPQQQWPSPMCYPSVPPNTPGPGWCGVPVPMMSMTPRGPYGWYNDMAPGSHPSSYARPSPQSNTQPVAAAFHPSSFVSHSPWADSSICQQQQQQQQQAVGEGEKFQAQGGPWPLPSENGQTTPLTYVSSDGFLGAQNAQGEGGGAFGETSAITFQKPVQDTASQDCEVSVSQHAESGRSNGGWRRYERHDPRDSFGDPAKVSGADHCSDGDNLDIVHKRNRGGLRQELDGFGNKNGVRQPLDSRKSADLERDALPLFPMGPALKDSLENARPDDHLFPGVIKAVPRAMVATAESTAEILLSIQNQRQQ